LDFKSAVNSINRLINDESNDNEFLFQTGIVESVAEENWSETSVSTTPIYQINGVIHGGHVRSITSHHTKTNLVVKFKDGSKRKSAFNTELDVVEGHQVTFAYHKASGDLVLFSNDDTEFGFWSGNEVMKPEQIQQMLNQNTEIKLSFFKELINPLRIFHTQIVLAMAFFAGIFGGGGFFLLNKTPTHMGWYVTIISTLAVLSVVFYLGAYKKVKQYYTKAVGGAGLKEAFLYGIGICIGMYFWLAMWPALFNEGPALMFLLISHFSLMIFSYPAKKHGLKSSSNLTNTFQKEQAIHYQNI